MKWTRTWVALLLVMVAMTTIATAGPFKLSLVGSGSGDPMTNITALRWGVPEEDKLRLVVDVSHAVQYKVSTINGDTPRLVVDILKSSMGDLSKDPVLLEGDIASRVRISQNQPDVVRLVVDLANPLNDGGYKVFTLPADVAAGKSDRLVIDLTKPAQESKLIQVALTPGLRNKIIVLDPGHGGSDSGAIGPAGTQEKDVTFPIVLQLKAMLEQAGAKVVLTRDKDVDVYGPNASAKQELQARVDVATNNQAHLFISVHANACSSPDVGGSGTYYYQKTTVDDQLATAIQQNLVAAIKLQDRGTPTARFYVLRRTQVPAALVEVAFLSNPKEEKLLTDNDFQDKTARGIYQGIVQFLASVGSTAKGGA